MVRTPNRFGGGARTNSNGLYFEQTTSLDAALIDAGYRIRGIEVYDGTKDFIEHEIDNKIRTLQTFVDKMNDLIDEMVIHLSSNKQDTGDINNLFEDMDDLIDSVKDY